MAKHRGRRTAPLKSKARSLARKPLSQTFMVSHLEDAQFKAGGLRGYALYRDLGIKAATKGMVDAHVNKRAHPWRSEEVSALHYHNVEFQMVYALKGWARFYMEGQGEMTMREGSCWIQPARIKHQLLQYSDDFEVLEITIPADYETIEVK